jgi:hypothetical protein
MTKKDISPDNAIVRATHGSPDHPLRIGSLEMPCYVLEDGRRVLVQTSMILALGMAAGGRGKYGVTNDRLARFTTQKTLSPYISEELRIATTDPIKFITPSNSLAYGYEATVLADICDAVLRAREDNILQKQQAHIAKQCEILVRGFARVGIIALVDEATGYQDVRSRQALEKILEQFISQELLKWAKTFPDDFYREMFRLRGWHYSTVSVKRPSFVGTLTNDLVYERLAPGILDELRRITPRDDKGRPKHRYHQRLTEDIGHPRLREHLTAVIALMRASSNWSQFYRMMARAFPKLNTTLPLPLVFPDEE